MRDRAHTLQCPPTRWSLVAVAAGPDEEDAQLRALDELLRVYQPVLRAYAQVRMGTNPEEAEDVAQGFVLDHILRKRLLAQADRDKGRFRNFLLKSFSNYVLSGMRRARAQKRGPAEALKVSLDENPDLVACEPEVTNAFDLAWAKQTISEALARMRRECGEKQRPDVWEVFSCRVMAPVLGQGDPPSYDELVRRSGVQSPSQASNLLITAKRMFRRALEGVVRDTVADEGQVQAEIEDLRRILLAGDAGLGTGLRSTVQREASTHHEDT